MAMTMRLIAREPSEEMMHIGLHHSSTDSKYEEIYTIWQAMWDVGTNAIDEDEASQNADLLQSDLGEMLDALGMGDHARPQSPHEVFQEALGVLRERLAGHADASEICAENLRLTSAVRQHEMAIRKLSHECLGEAIRILRTLLMRRDCDIPGESWLMLAISTMESRQQKIAEQQMAALAGKDEAA